jgi:hypothetical protein
MAEEMKYFTNDRRREYRGYNLVQTDPFGFWHIEHTDGNKTPKELKESEYTDYPLAHKAIDAYLSRKALEENRPPLDKNTRKVQEVLKGKVE